jgi:hypothetical protein
MDDFLDQIFSWKIWFRKLIFRLIIEKNSNLHIVIWKLQVATDKDIILIVNYKLLFTRLYL